MSQAPTPPPDTSPSAAERERAAGAQAPEAAGKPAAATPSFTAVGRDYAGMVAAATSNAAPPWLLRWQLPVVLVLAALAAGALALAYTAQQRVRQLEADLGRRQHENTQSANEARLLARQAESAARDMVAKITLLEARVAETAMQRSQFEDLLQSLARSRDENVLADVEAAVRVAQQQSAITGSAEPLLLVLRQSEERLSRHNQPRLERVRRAVAQDLERTRAAGSTELSTLTIRLDDVVRQVDDLPLLAVPPHPAAARRARAPVAELPALIPAAPAAPAAAAGASSAVAGAGGATSIAARTAAGIAAGTVAAPPLGFLESLRQTWANLVAQVWTEARSLLRVTRIDDPEAMLIAPEQAYFLRENLKLRLLNARLALLSRQFDTAQSDLRESLAALDRYFDRSARRTVLAADALRQVMAQARTVAVPRPDATLAAIATASAGR